ncbi:MAG: hypothetical protein ACR2MG_02580 [Pyrinomonadaceae bacterium]
MRQFTLRLSIVLVTFFIGVSAVFIWFFNSQANSDALPINVSTTEKKIATIESNPISSFNEDYAVYSAILTNGQYDNEIIVINDYTSHGLIADARNPNQKISGLTEDTINDYQAKNEENQKLVNNFTVSGKVVFISEKEENQLFRKGQDGWANFYKKYPKAKRMISFSRVGFNQERTQALVSVSVGCGWLCGEGSFIVLQKENGKWIVQRNIGLWVS